MKSSEVLPVPGLASEIRHRISGKVAIAGIGNIIRADDGLGPKVIELMKARNIPASLFDCGTAPENYIFPILSTACSTVILIDAADMGIPAGGIKIFSIDEISSVSFSTHNPSPRLFADLLKTGKDELNIFVVSIQPKSASLGAPISGEVLASCEILSEAFSEALNAQTDN